ncbi:hemolysin family protein [Georgenia sp. TF02-10]|uniref:hemolysin family protein n=1 Tax=Georgenia sp. TF02-10 TaxID=2917725 RepID=UPI001FA6ECCD|nr:hemolysin family protein [Georgenia sp. TF02-10]UNX53611.1 hemolysin family protein [Georgenia sp. TF02-10]
MIHQVPAAWLGVLVLLGLVVGGALSAGEAALARVTRAAVADLAAAGQKNADAVARLVDRRDLGLAAATFVRVLAEMTAAVCLTLVVAGLLPRWWQVLLAAVVLTALLVAALVRVSPRRLGRRNPAGVLAVLVPVMGPLTTVAGGVARVVRAVVPGPARTAAETREERGEELRDMVDRVSESEQIQEDERELLHSVFELGRTLTREVMVPRTDMVTIDADADLEAAITLFTRSGYSRVPVVGESTDDVRGVLYLKDVMRRVHRRTDTAGLTVADVMRPPVFVPETKLVDDLLQEMQADSIHIAMVVDEYGGIAGLVTIEDLLEELVGEMVDEHDRAEPEVEPVGDGVVRVPARLPVDDLGELFGLEIDDDDVDSAGGLLAKALGIVPLPGAEADVHGLHLVAERAEGRRRRLSTLLASRSDGEEEA